MSDTERPQGFGQPHIDFAQALVQLARDSGVRSFEGSIRLGWDREHAGWSGDRVEISWSEGRHGDDSNISLRCDKTAVVPEIAPNSARIQPNVYFDGDEFREAGDRKPKSDRFRQRWLHRAADYPQSREAAIDAMSPDTRDWFLKRWPQ